MSHYIIAAVDDIFFASKIRATAEHLNINVRFAKTIEAVIAAALEEKPSLILVDLHSERCDPLALARQLKRDQILRQVQLIGFFSHIQTALQQQAREAGYDRVLARSTFTKYLPEILQSKGDA